MLRFRRRLPLAQTFSGELDPVGVVDDSVENGVGERRDANHIVPAIDGNLAGDDEGALVVAVLDDFEEIAGLIGRQGFRPQSSRMSSLTRASERRSLPYRASPWAIARSAKSRGMRV